MLNILKVNNFIIGFFAEVLDEYSTRRIFTLGSVNGLIFDVNFQEIVEIFNDTRVLTFAVQLECLFHGFHVLEWFAHVFLEFSTLHLILEISFDSPINQLSNMACLTREIYLVACEHGGNYALGFRKANITERKLGKKADTLAIKMSELIVLIDQWQIQN